ncbi:MAG: CPBP family glutamic-type intramembrane protease [bacterium]|nr:CPBP family glutamic-type intramembrane protease [bacterium]
MESFFKFFFVGLLLLAVFLARRADTHPTLGRIGSKGLLFLPPILLLVAAYAGITRGVPHAVPILLAFVGVSAILFRPTRQFLCRFVPMDLDCPSHVFLLVAVWLLIINTLSGILIQQLPETLNVALPDVAFQESIFVFGSLLAAGLWNGVSFSAILASFGLTRPTIRTFSISLIATVALYVGLIFVLGLIAIIGTALGFSPEQWLTEQPTTYTLLEKSLTPTTIFLIPILVALGEEMLFRGLLQPLLGFWFTVVFFVMVHLPQNSFHPIALLLFLPAIVLGFLRMRYNLTTSILTHMWYNMGLLALALFASNTENFLAHG